MPEAVTMNRQIMRLYPLRKSLVVLNSPFRAVPDIVSERNGDVAIIFTRSGAREEVSRTKSSFHSPAISGDAH